MLVPLTVNNVPMLEREPCNSSAIEKLYWAVSRYSPLPGQLASAAVHTNRVALPVLLNSTNIYALVRVDQNNDGR